MLKGETVSRGAPNIMTDLLRQEIAALATTLVVKVGTQVLTRDDGQLDQARIDHLARQLHDVVNSGRKAVLVSSGAVGAGMGRLGMTQRPTALPQLQAVAAIGQSLLVEAYEHALSPYGHHAAQVLLTAEDLEHRTRYLNARNTLLALLELGAIPIINENDTVSVEELHTTFGDNDRLAAIVTNLIRAPLLVLLSDVAGLCDGDPCEPGSKIIDTVDRLDNTIYDLVRDKSGGRGKGGMASKLEAARLCTSAGENLIIASGRDPDVLGKIVAGKLVGTLFLARGQSLAARKRWIGFTVKPRGLLRLDAGRRGDSAEGPQPAGGGDRGGRRPLCQGRHRGPSRHRQGGDRSRTDQLWPRRPRSNQGAADQPDRQGPGRMPVRRGHPPRQHGGHSPGGVTVLGRATPAQ